MSEQSAQKDHVDAKPPPPTRAQRLAAFAFLGAFGLTILTVILTGLSVGAPAARHVLQPVPPGANTRFPAPRTEAPSVSTAPLVIAPPPTVSVPSTSENAAREDAERDRDDAARKKDALKDADDSPANDAR